MWRSAVRAFASRRIWRKVLRALASAAVVVGLVVLFVVSAYGAFNLFVGRGVTAVPDVSGLPLDNARQVLADQGLRLRHEESAERYSEGVPEGHVAEQRPRPGVLAKRGGAVEVIVSRGQQLVPVPDLLGQAFQAAQVNVAASALMLGRAARISGLVGRTGTVVAQFPAPGAMVQRGAAVDLFLATESRGGTFVMPELVYRRYDDVREFFELRGFGLGSVKYESYEGVEPGVVLRQYPLAGHPLHRDEVISLVVATMPEPSPLS
jgi:serine/threonine-protein kinase